MSGPTWDGESASSLRKALFHPSLRHVQYVTLGSVCVPRIALRELLYHLRERQPFLRLEANRLRVQFGGLRSRGRYLLGVEPVAGAVELPVVRARSLFNIA